MDFLVGIDLQDSFVLGWSYNDQTLRIQLEFSIWPESEYYEPPKAGDYTCYRSGTILFSGVSEIHGLLNQCEVEPTQDLDRSDDYGNIDIFERRQSYFNVVGGFGDLKFESFDVKLELHK